MLYLVFSPKNQCEKIKGYLKGECDNRIDIFGKYILFITEDYNGNTIEDGYTHLTKELNKIDINQLNKFLYTNKLLYSPNGNFNINNQFNSNGTNLLMKEDNIPIPELGAVILKVRDNQDNLNMEFNQFNNPSSYGYNNQLFNGLSINNINNEIFGIYNIKDISNKTSSDLNDLLNILTICGIDYFRAKHISSIIKSYLIPNKEYLELFIGLLNSYSEYIKTKSKLKVDNKYLNNIHNIFSNNYTQPMTNSMQYYNEYVQRMMIKPLTLDELKEEIKIVESLGTIMKDIKERLEKINNGEEFYKTIFSDILSTLFSTDIDSLTLINGLDTLKRIVYSKNKLNTIEKNTKVNSKIKIKKENDKMKNFKDENKLNILVEKINQFFIKEYMKDNCEDYIKDSLYKNERINLASTNAEYDDELSFNVDLDIKNLKLIFMVDDEEVNSMSFKSLDEVIDYINSISFEELVDDDNFPGYTKYED